jgi:hypothetical protein
MPLVALHPAHARPQRGGRALPAVRHLVSRLRRRDAARVRLDARGRHRRVQDDAVRARAHRFPRRRPLRLRRQPHRGAL